MGVILRAYRKNLVHRYDDEGYIKYFSAADFPGLTDEPFFFPSGPNRLAGHIYSCEGCREDTLLIFCHGIGAGHRAYMTEIDLLCRAGYRVAACDNTGCLDSEGGSILCMSQSLADLDCAVRYLKQQGIFGRYRHVYVIGHSWGGFAAGNIPALHPEIQKAVVISGFVSVERLLRGTLGGAKDPVRKCILRRLLAYEKKTAPAYCGASVSDALAHGAANYLIAHSTDDSMVPYADNAGYLKETAPENARFLILSDRKHNPNYTLDAVSYMNEIFGAFNQALKAGKLKTLEQKKAFFADTDWVRMTRQDPAFWQQVIGFLEEEP